MDGGPRVDVLVVSATSKGKDQTIARTLASKPRAPEEITPAERDMPPRKRLRHFPYFTVQLRERPRVQLDRGGARDPVPRETLTLLALAL